MRVRREANWLGSIATLTVLVLAVTAYGASFTVDTTSEGDDAVPGDGICATATGSCSLRAAVEEANSLPGADSIALGAFVYPLVAGALDISDDLTITGAGADNTVIRGNGRARIATVSNGVTFAITGARLEHGVAASGGALLNNGTLQLTNVTIANNRAMDFGGGVYNNGSLQVTGATFLRNRAMGLIGGFGGGVFNNGSAQFVTVTFKSNRVNGCGGAIFNASGDLELMNATVRNNRALKSGGGFFDQDGTVKLTNVTINANHVHGIGGGVFSYAPLELTNVTVDGNHAFWGGGLFCSYGTATFMNVTISRNRAAQGGGLSISKAQVILTNTIVAGNRSQNCAGDAPISHGNNLDSETSCRLLGSGDLTRANAMLGRLQDNGGATFTAALLGGSSAIDAGTNVGAPTEDQRGAPRPADGNGDHTAAYDIGAYEKQP